MADEVEEINEYDGEDIEDEVEYEEPDLENYVNQRITIVMDDEVSDEEDEPEEDVVDILDESSDEVQEAVNSLDHTDDGYVPDTGDNLGEEGEELIPEQDFENPDFEEGVISQVYATDTIYITNYDQVYLKSLHDDGYTFYAVYTDGTRSQVNYTEVSSPLENAAHRIIVEASDIGAASNQHFWDDSNGIHVAQDSKDDWEENTSDEYVEVQNPSASQLSSYYEIIDGDPIKTSDVSVDPNKTYYVSQKVILGSDNDHPYHNILINSLGILLRKAYLNLVSIGRSAVTFYDGAGNDENNILAFFGAQSAQIGRSNAKHLVLSNEGVTAYSGDGNLTELIAIIDGVNLRNASITGSKLSDSTITGSKIASSTITDSNIQNGTITGSKLSDSTITGSKIASSTIVNSNILDGTITGAKIQGSTLTNIPYAEIDELKSKNITSNAIQAATGYIGQLSAGNLTANNLLADHATVGALDSTYATITNLNASNARITDLETDHVSTDDLDAATARIDDLEADHVSVTAFEAEQANIDNLQAATADIQTIRANSAKVQNLTAAQLEADHATVGSLATTYAQINMGNVNNAWIENGVVKNGAITNAMIHDVSANKLTAGTIDASNITVTNLNADNITTGTINGQRIGTGSLSLDKLEDDVYTETEVDALLSDMQRAIDGAIETWTGAAVPTLNNSPANTWTTNDIKDTHVGDVYFVVNDALDQNGYNYRFTKTTTNNVSTYAWQLIKDNDITQALQRLYTAEGKIGTIEEFDSDISSWKTETDEGLTTIRSNHSALVTKVNGTIKSSVQLWITTNSTTAPNKPNSHVTINDASNHTSWNLAVPSYSSSYPNYYYCYEWEYANGTYGWSGVTRDIAMGETQQQARQGVADAASAMSAASSAQSVADTALHDSIEYIVGTHGTTATNAWTGITRDSSLYAGKTIAFYLTSGGTTSAATLNLTLSGGGTTGAKNVRYNNSNVTNHYPAGTILKLTYDGTYWKTHLYNVDTVNRTKYDLNIIAAEAITSGHIICGNSTGYRDIAASLSFDLTYPLLYAGTTIAKGATTGTRNNNFLEINNINYSNNGTIQSGANGKTIYLKGTVSGSIFTLASSNFLTTVVPTSTSDDRYIPLGIMSSATAGYFNSSARLYAYLNGAFQAIDTAAYTSAGNAQATANENIKSSTQLWITVGNSVTSVAKPTTHVTTNNASTPNVWNLAVPTYNASYPRYYYCYEYQKGDNSYFWSDVIFDSATTENQKNARDALSEVATKVSSDTFNELTEEVGNISTSITSLNTITDSLTDAIDGYLGKWRIDRFTKPSGIGAIPEESDFIETNYIDTKYRDDSDMISANWAYGNDYIARVCTYAHCSTDISTSVAVKHDDNAGMYINNGDNILTKTGNRDSTATLVLNTGWNKIEFRLNEGTGNDYVYINTTKLTDITGIDAICANLDIYEATVNNNTVNTVKQTTESNSSSISQLQTFTETASNPNLTPWFSRDVSDSSYWYSLHVRNGSVSNTEGLHRIYNKHVDGTDETDLYLDGWAHITLDARSAAGNDGSKACYMNMHVAKNQLIDLIKPNSKYTWMIEVKNLTLDKTEYSAGIFAISPSVDNDTLDIFNRCTITFTEDGVAYGVVTSKSDYSALTTCATRGYAVVSHGVYADFLLRISLYEGEYTGPYKPYVDNGAQTQINSVVSRQSTLEQTLEGFQTTVSSTYATQTSVNNLSSNLSGKINNIKVGGENLLPISSVAVDDTKTQATTTTSSDTNNYKDTFAVSVPRVLGATEYVVSFEAMSSVEGKEIGCFWHTPSTTTYAESSTGQTGTGSNGYCKVTLSTSWNRYWVKWTQSDSADTNKLLSVGRNYKAVPATVTVRKVKFEIGNIPTQWSPPIAYINGRIEATYATSNTAAGTAAKVATCSNFVLYTGARISVKFDNLNSATTPTLNVNSTGAKTIRGYNGSALTKGEYEWKAGAVIDFVYDGTYWRMIDNGVTERVTQAETQIDQNEEAIALRATKTEAIQMAQPNLSPIFSRKPLPIDSGSDDKGYTQSGNGFWRYWTVGANSGITALDDGWAHYEYTASSATRLEWSILPISNLKPDTLYTFLVEIRNVSVADTDKSISLYLVQGDHSQFWGGSYVNILENTPDNYTASNSISINNVGFNNQPGIFVKRYTKKTEPATSSNWTGGGNFEDAREALRYTSNYTAGASGSFDVRISFYEGEYWGPYKPYVGDVLYSTQAELKVANDQINMKVNTNGVISAINLSSESATISAEKVNIAGAALFTGNGYLSQTSLNNAYDSKGSASAALTSANSATDTKLASYSTTSQMNSAIGTAKSEAITSANSTTDTKLANYTTTSGMNTAITNAVNNIQIGGTNLLISSGDPSKAKRYLPNTYNIAGFYMRENFVIGDTYTCTIWGDPPTRSDKSTCYYSLYWSGGQISLGNISISNGKGTHTFQVPNATSTDATIDPPFLAIYNTPSSGASGTTYTANIVKIKLEKGNKATDWTPAPEDVTADISESGVEYINGTQTAKTGAWTGVTKDSSLVAGKKIAYRLPYAGNGEATLELTFPNGTTSGAKAVFLNTTRMTTHFGAGSVIQMVYTGTDWRATSIPNTNNYDRRLHNNYVKAADKLTGYSICVGTASGYKTAAASVAFDLSYPVLYLSAANVQDQTYAVASGGQTAAMYEAMPSINPANTGTVQSAAVNKVVYLKGTVLGNTMTLASSNFLTCATPSSEDGFVYIPVGTLANDATSKLYFSSSKDLYAFLDTKFRQVTPTEIVAEQDIYISKTDGTSSINSNLVWVSDRTGSQNTWTAKRPVYNQSYPVLFVAHQAKRLDGTVTCTTPHIDDTTTIIDGGHIITNTVTADKLNAANINASKSLTIGALTDNDQAIITNAAKTASNYISADSSGIKIASSNPSSATTYQHQTSTATEFYISNIKRNVINADGMTLYDVASNQIAAFGSTIDIGKEEDVNIRLDPSAGFMVRYPNPNHVYIPVTMMHLNPSYRHLRINSDNNDDYVTSPALTITQDGTFITNYGMAISDENTHKNLFSIGNSIVRIGDKTESHIDIDSHSFDILDNDNKLFFDLRNYTKAKKIIYPTSEDYSNGYVVTYLPSNMCNQTGKILYCTNSSFYNYDENNHLVRGENLSYTEQIVNNRVEITISIDNQVTAVEIIYEISNNAYSLSFGERGDAWGIVTSVDSNDHSILDMNTTGVGSVTFGTNNIANGDYSYAEGLEVSANGDYSHAEGWGNSAKGTASHSEGFDNLVNGNYSHAEGSNNNVYGDSSHVSGSFNDVYGNYSAAFGSNLYSYNDNLTVLGRFNENTSYAGNKLPLLLIGNGTDELNRSTSLIAYDNGDLTITGSFTGNIDASNINSGTLNASRIPNLNTSKLTAGTLGIARGGTGNTAVSSTTTIADIITMKSGWTCDVAKYMYWGKVAQLNLRIQSTTDLTVPATGNFTNVDVATIKSGKCPANEVGYVELDFGTRFVLKTDGTLALLGGDRTGSAYSIASSNNHYLKFVYLLP